MSAWKETKNLLTDILDSFCNAMSMIAQTSRVRLQCEIHDNAAFFFSI